MLACFWKVWDWLNPKAMDNKVSFLENEGVRNELSDTNMGSVMKHQYTTSDDYRPMLCSAKPINYSNYNSVIQQQPQLEQKSSAWTPISVQEFPIYSNHNSDLISPGKPKPALKSTKLQDVKKNTAGQQLRSPSAKRPPHGTVILQGWLHKQGSEGLKVWRKRWFVLSDYCLYYYKGPEEEKVLGSILLPSYKVSVCTPKDKVYRKFAFKCEHANMRTYYLASDSEQSMTNWIQSLNLACTLQTNVNSERQIEPNKSLTPNIYVKNNDSGHQQYNTFTHSPNTPVHLQSHSIKTVGSHSENIGSPNNPISNYSCDINSVNNIQPLYANAPPKPRRIAEEGYSTPSPEFFLTDIYQNVHNHLNYPYNRTNSRNDRIYSPKPQGNTNMYVNNCNNCTLYPSTSVPKSASISYDIATNPIHSNHVYEHQIYTPSHRESNVERRTPDTYGRAKLNSMKIKDKSDYEDVYADDVMYKRPLSPVAYSNIKKISPVASINVQQRPYISMFTPGISELDAHNVRTQPVQYSDRIPVNTIPRPHSADFLDYEIKYRKTNKLNSANCQQPRPKSSLDITRSYNDNYYYSEETYAENMRKQALYLQQLPLQHHRKNNDYLGVTHNHNIYQRRKHPHEFSRNQKNLQYTIESNPIQSEDSFNFIRATSPYSKNSMGHLKHEHTNSNHSESFPRENEYHDDQFKRSASARLLWTPQEELNESVNKDGLQKREESMKRLLEWKQRMLQSPLNRKTSLGYVIPASHTVIDRPELYARPHTHYTHPTVDKFRPYANANTTANVSVAQYSSYSSDDEENDLNRSKKEKVIRCRLLQAGWTKEDHTLTNSPAVSASTTRTAFDVPLSLDTERNKSNSSQNNSSSQLPSTNSRPSSAVESISTLTSIPTSRTASIVELTFESKSPGSLSLSTNLRNKCENSDNDTTFTSTEHSFYCGANENLEVSDAVKESHENVDASDLPKDTEQLYEDLLLTCASKEASTNVEENYMTMTPKAPVLLTHSLHQRQSSYECDENAYMEMTQGLGVSLLSEDQITSSEIKLNSDIQPYEVVCFNDNKIEPVYVELNNSSYAEKSILMKLTDKELLNDKMEMPDILMASKNKNTKSDSSDADDEASKDLDSLDAPCHPRFSLSDTFRPASYYLGANRVLTEFHDSSDSELVSPPPIPTSPPPMDDLDNSFFKQEKNPVDCTSPSNVTDFFYSKKTAMSPLSEEVIDNNDSFRSKYYFSSENLKEQDYVSVFSTNLELPKKQLSARLSHNSDSDVELRNYNTIDYAQKLKRRPVSSEEFCDELESRFSESLDETSLSIDRYLDDLNFSNVSNASKDPNNSYYLKTNYSESSHDEYKNSPITNALIKKDEIKTDRDIKQSTTPVLNTVRSENDNDNSFSLNSSATVPYYYSDLASNITDGTNDTSLLFTLNNQRIDTNADKKHITHITNPIRSPNLGHNYRGKLRFEARPASADILNEVNKVQKNKNVASKSKSSDEANSAIVNSDAVNLYYICPNLKQIKLNGINIIRKTHSLEGLLEYVWDDSGTGTGTGTETETTATSYDTSIENSSNTLVDVTQEGSHVWEEDSLWKEQLRNASQRQTRPLDNFDQLSNDSKSDKNKTPKLDVESTSENNSVQDQEQSKKTFTIDRETLRQWDLLSSASAPSISSSQIKCSVSTATAVRSTTSSSIITTASSATVTTTTTSASLSTSASSTPPDNLLRATVAVPKVDAKQGVSKQIFLPNYDEHEQHPASGSTYVATHDTFPRMVTKKPWASNTLTPSKPTKSTFPTRPSQEFDHLRMNPYYYDQSPISSHPEENSSRPNLQHASWQWSDRINMTAGELLGRTHEELVLLLIQLRRQSTHIYHAIETCYTEIDNIQSQLNIMSAAKRAENLQKLEYLKQHLLELEKQYEKGKPLVNLVDNMVKLGSLYRHPNDQYHNSNVKDRLEFNQQIQEQRLLAEERKDWHRFNSNHTQLQSKVQQLYQLDRLLQEESGTLQCLQYDKEKIERALSGLRHQLNKGYKDPVEIEQARKQQIRLENELSRVHFMLAQNSKKLEETVAGNARLEQELLVLRQKLQLSRQHRSSAQFSNTGAGDSLPCAAGTSAMLEAELHRVQQLVGDLQRQRQELSTQVRQLTDKSHTLSQQIGPTCTTPIMNSTNNKKRTPSFWRETDLDTMISIDHGSDWDLQNKSRSSSSSYISDTVKQIQQNDISIDKIEDNNYQFEAHSSPQNTEDIPQEKTEIKTVRIVKRESERRQRDKEKSNTISEFMNVQQKWDPVVEEDNLTFNNSYLSTSTQNETTVGSDNISELNIAEDNNPSLNRFSSRSNSSLYSQKGSYTNDADSSIDEISVDKSPDMSPVFKSEAARQIIIEMSGGIASEPSTLKKCVRRTIPREKRRHYTAPHNNIISKSTLELDNKSNVDSRRARDDLDMERALRHRTDTPDVVRSTMNRKELKYNESTIDNILGTPNKINIPERYIPEKLPQLSVEEQKHRLRKVESIKKMLSDTILSSTPSITKSVENENNADQIPDSEKTVAETTSKMVEEKRQREHLLQLNQILAKQVMEMSKIVAVKALATLPLQPQKISLEEEDLSPVTPLPLYQQRDNFYS